MYDVDETVIDAKDVPIKVGARVQVYGYDAAKDKYEEMHGTVTEITEWDGDVNDYGRTVGIPPEVTVQFDDGTEDSFRCTCTYRDPRTICDELVVINPEAQIH